MKPNIFYTAYTNIHPLVRWRFASYEDPSDGNTITDYEFDILTRPFFFGLLGKKCWIFCIATNSFQVGNDFAMHLMQKEIDNYNKINPPVDIFDAEYLKFLGYSVVSDNGQYGSAISDVPKGKRRLSYNRDKDCTYLGIQEDCETRSVYNGTVESREHLELLLRLVR